MYKSFLILVIVLLFPLLSSGGGLSKSKIFGIAGFSCSLLAIGADIAGEHYYDKYEKSLLPDDCEHYRNMTQICENTRDISFGLAVINFSVSTIFLLKEKKSDTQIKIGYKRGQIWAGFVKLLY